MAVVQAGAEGVTGVAEAACGPARLGALGAAAAVDGAPHTAVPLASRVKPLITWAAVSLRGHRISVSRSPGLNPEPVMW